MSRTFIAVLLTLVGLGVLNRSEIAAEWVAMYPNDPALRVALYYCYNENQQFNRMSAEARDACYNKWLPIIYR
jgi:hypothetical protein